MSIYRNSDFYIHNNQFKVNETSSSSSSLLQTNNSNKNKNKLKGALLNLTGNFFLSISIFLTKYIITHYDYVPLLSMHFYRSIPTFLIATYQCLREFQVMEIKSKVCSNLKTLLFRCANAFVNFIALILAAKYLKITTSSTIYSISPVVTSFLAVLFLNEKVTHFNLVCLIVSLIGCVILSNPFRIGQSSSTSQTDDSLIGFIFAFIFVFSRGTTVILQKTLSSNIPIALSILVINFSNFILSFFLSSLFSENGLYSLILQGYSEVLLLIISGINIYVAMFLIFSSLKEADVVFLQMFYPSIILFGFILSTCLFNEVHGFFDFLGAGIVLIINIYSSYKVYLESVNM